MDRTYSIQVFCQESQKRPPERSRPRSEVNVKLDRREIGWDDMDWTHLTQHVDQWWGLVNTVMNLRAP
jgi:hypothetical protein